VKDILDFKDKKNSSVEFIKGKEMVMELLILVEYVPPPKIPT
jgi:hypothetical protein